MISEFGSDSGRYAVFNENFILVGSGITAGLSLEFPVLSEDGNRFYSKLTTQNYMAQPPLLLLLEGECAARMP
jgi:hypothetical protein